MRYTLVQVDELVELHSLLPSSQVPKLLGNAIILIFCPGSHLRSAPYISRNALEKRRRRDYSSSGDDTGDAVYSFAGRRARGAAYITAIVTSPETSRESHKFDISPRISTVERAPGMDINALQIRPLNKRAMRWLYLAIDWPTITLASTKRISSLQTQTHAHAHPLHATRETRTFVETQPNTTIRIARQIALQSVQLSKQTFQTIRRSRSRRRRRRCFRGRLVKDGRVSHALGSRAARRAF
mmetsp:Transcript_24084/g.43360  ORF Transcript_24084/g.43360 Transcript_24084/m.43360 type:complete len:241 (-) Transcript_24084:183-905(-)